MERPSVSIIIPCYNTARYLGEAIRSALDQSYAALEIVVVDDGSTDESARVAESFERVRCIRQTNQGVSAARNRGIRETRGDFVVFLDADDRLNPGALETGVRVLEAHPGYGFVYGHSRDVDNEGNLIAEHDLPVVDAGYASLLAGRGLAPPAVAMFRRGPLEKIGGFNETMKLAEDHDLYLRLAREFPIYCHNRIVADYRQHSRNASHVSPAATLRGVLATIDAQRDWIRGKPEFEAAARRGRRHWRRIFGPHLPYEMMAGVRRRRFTQAGRALRALARHYPIGLLSTPVIVLQATFGWLDFILGWDGWDGLA